MCTVAFLLKKKKKKGGGKGTVAPESTQLHPKKLYWKLSSCYAVKLLKCLTWWKDPLRMWLEFVHCVSSSLWPGRGTHGLADPRIQNRSLGVLLFSSEICTLMCWVRRSSVFIPGQERPGLRALFSSVM